jgi:hypothetical protein
MKKFLFNLLFTIMFLLFIIQLFVFFLNIPIPVRYETHTVETGDSLINISVKYNPNAEPKYILEEIRRVNKLPNVLYVGDTIKIPIY